MARIVEYRDIPLEDLGIDRGQVRTQSPGEGVDELAESIRVQGLLQPIVVCEGRPEGKKWEILTGQRRFLAHRMLKKKTITAAILDSRVEESEAKAISITENLMRRKLSGKELTDAILYLHGIYGSIKDVVTATGLPANQVRNHVRLPRLIPELKKLVGESTVDIDAALKAQDASVNEDGDPVPDIAVQLAMEMTPMSNVQRKEVAKIRKQNPKKPINDIIEEAKSGDKVIQVIATISGQTHSAIKEVAKVDQVNQDVAVTNLIEEALKERGLIEP